MKGLIYREAALMKKSLILTVAVYVMCMIFSAVVLLAFNHGNLDRSDTDTFELIRLYASLILIVVGMCGLTMGQNNIVAEDYKTKWMGYQYTLPLSEETIAKAKIGLRVIYFIIGMALAFFGELYVGIISGTGFRSNMIVLIIGLGLFSGLGAMEIPLTMRLKNVTKASLIAGVAGLPVGVIAAVVIGKITKELGQRIEAMQAAARAAGEEGPVNIGDPMKLVLEIAQPYLDTFRFILIVFGIPFIALMFFLAYKLTVKELKRRSL